MREFNLEEAKRGVPVCTRDGHAAIIICTSCQSSTLIVALVCTYSDGVEKAVEVCQSFYKDGRLLTAGEENNIDLFIQF